MPIIPNYAARGPAGPAAPAMEQVQRERVDASGALRGLGQVAEQVQEMAQPLAGVDMNQGQGAMRGLQAIGEGARQVGQALFDIRERVAEARNFTLLSEAQAAMDREVGEFEKWKLQTPDPGQWENEWRTRLDKFKGQITTGNYPPAVRDAIAQRVTTFGERHAIQIGVDAAREQVGLARASLEAEILRATQAGDYDSVQALADQGFQQGWIAEDTAERMKLSALDKIESDAISAGMNQMNALLMYGDVQGAKDTLSQIPGLSPDERALKMAEIETRHAASIEEGEIYDRAATEAGGPIAIARELDEVDESGNPVKYPHLKGAARADVKAKLWAGHYQERESIAATVKEGIDNGSLQSMDDVDAMFDGYDLTPIERASFEQRLRGEFVKDEEYVQTAFGKAASYDPANDPTGQEFGAISNEIAIKMGDDPRAADALAVLQKRRNGEALTIGEATKAQKIAEYKAMIDAEGSWQLNAENVKAIEKDGAKIYVDTGSEGKEGQPGYVYDDGGFLGRGRWYRRVALSQDDRLKVEEGKGVVTDLEQKNRKWSEIAPAIDEITRGMDSGQIMDGEQADAKWQGITLPIRDKTAQSQISSGLFPATPASDRIEAARQRAAQLRGN